MNCKRGDLAVFVRSLAGNEGVMVTCLRLATKDELDVCRFAHELAWLIDRPLKMSHGGMAPLAADEFLRPIRPQADDADCNSKAWLPPVPQKEVA